MAMLGLLRYSKYGLEFFLPQALFVYGYVQGENTFRVMFVILVIFCLTILYRRITMFFNAIVILFMDFK